MGIYSITIFHTVCEGQSWGSSRYNAAPLEIKSCVFFGDTLKNIVPTEKLCLLGCYLNHRGQLWTTWNRYLQNTTSTLNKLHCLLSVFQIIPKIFYKLCKAAPWLLQCEVQEVVKHGLGRGQSGKPRPIIGDRRSERLLCLPCSSAVSLMCEVLSWMLSPCSSVACKASHCYKCRHAAFASSCIPAWWIISRPCQLPFKHDWFISQPGRCLDFFSLGNGLHKLLNIQYWMWDLKVFVLD